ncbi:MAG: PQQ-binding-like beta-propeller repeat protein, partial [Anaerolineales bacterium]|nr:PQQ-binding-like beta-propeller repeat protein [Anaerolineales bacterium]
MNIPFNSMYGFLSTTAIVLGIFLVLAGTGIVHWESLTVERGRRTLGVGVLFIILGIIFMRVDSRSGSTVQVTVVTPQAPITTQTYGITSAPITTEPSETPTEIQTSPTPPEITSTPTIAFTSTPSINEQTLVLDGGNLQRTSDYGAGLTPKLKGERWRSAVDNFAVHSNPIFVNGTLYFGTGNYQSEAGAFYAIEALTGHRLWKKSLDRGAMDGAAYFNNKVFFGDTGGIIYALDAETGEDIWRFPAGGSIYSSPTIYDGLLFLGNTNGNLFVLDPESGVIDKTYQELGGTVRSLVVADNTLYAAAGSNLYKINEEGNQLDLIFSAEEYLLRPPVFRDSVLYIVVTLPGEENHSLVYALETDGDEIWETPYDISGKVDTDHAVSENAVLVSTTDGILYAINRFSGQELWQFETSGEIRSSPTIVNNIAYFGSWPNRIYGLDIETG